MTRSGKVFIIGAGPGNPGLLTLRGAECLSTADVVLRDALVNRRILEHCRPGARIIESGKSGQRPVPIRQPQINKLIARLARSGKTVARLKNGDPFFLGRGGEEAEYLARRGIPFEVIPGVSSVQAVPAYAGIPLTQPAHSSTVTVVTSRGKENTFLGKTGNEIAEVDWNGLPKSGTLVVLMGRAQLEVIAQRLITAGWPESTPAAVIQWGTRPNQRTVEGPLRSISYQADKAGLRPPAVIVIGSVVSLRRRLNWFERLPLFSRNVVVTRAESQASNLVRLLENEGAQALESPAIFIERLPLRAAGRVSLRRLEQFDGVIFSSSNAVQVFLDHYLHLKRSWPPETKIYAIGIKTARSLIDGGLPVHCIAKEYFSESLLHSLGTVQGRRFLIPRALEGRDFLTQTLAKKGAEVQTLDLYRTRPSPMAKEIKQLLRDGAVDCVTFTSPSTVRYFLRAFRPKEARAIFRKTLALSIGPTTSQALRENGIRRLLQATNSTVEEMVISLRQYFSRSTKRS